jgi:conjugal transfer pilus assembly protein TraK
MKPTPSIALLLAAAVLAPAHAQQIAHATFATEPTASAMVPSGPVRSARPPKAAAPSKSTPALKTDRLALHPEAAIRDTKAPEIVLPGVLKIAGADAQALDFSRARIIDVTNGGSQTVYVSALDQNRIQLPWPNTKVVGTDELLIDKRPTSNNVYVQFRDAVQRAVQVYFEQPDGPSVLGLQLVPKQIPAQTILVRDASRRTGEQKPVRANDYVAATQALMEQVALGAAPQGFSQVELAVGPIALNGLVVTPQRQYSSADRDIYVYDVANPGPYQAALQEKEFDGESVLAISIFPAPVLAAGEHTRVIVLARKAAGG